MKDNEYDLCVLICRIQPLHLEHFKTMQYGLKVASNLLVLVGSAQESRTEKNPWNFHERREMIQSCFNKEDNQRINIRSLNDCPGENLKWVDSVMRWLNECAEASRLKNYKIGLLGGAKQEWYMDLLPNKINRVETPGFVALNATDVRKHYFSERDDDWDQTLFTMVPPPVYQFLASMKPCLEIIKA